MEIINDKKCYSSEEFRAKISDFILKHSKDLEKEIKKESQFISKKEVVYV